MSHIINERFSIGYESGTAVSYLVLKSNSGEKVQGYQVEMIASNPNPGILPLDVRQKDNIIYFYYNITSKLALSQFLRRKKLKRNEFIDILSNILKTLIDGSGYLLSDKCFVLDEDLVFINPDTLEVSLIYMPIVLDSYACKNYKDFVMNLIVSSADIDESGSDNFIQRILSQVKSDTVNLLELDRLLKDLKNPAFSPADNKAVQQAGVQSLPDMDRGYFSSRQGMAENKLSSNKCLRPEHQKINESKVSGRVKASAADIPAPHAVKQNMVKTEKAEKTGLNYKYKPKTIAAAAILQLGIIAILAAVYASGVLKSIGEDTATTIALLAVILGAVDFLAIKKLFDKSKVIESAQAEKNRKAVPVPNPINISKKEIRNIPRKPVVDNSRASHANTAMKEPLKQSDLSDARTVLLSCGSNDTTVLVEAPGQYPVLQGKKDGVIEEIIVNKPSFVIGRLKEQVDYVSSNNAVGKVHAEIITRDDGCYIKDLNSRNGTFINGDRIDSNKEYEINNNDDISFANSDYKFISV